MRWRVWMAAGLAGWGAAMAAEVPVEIEVGKPLRDETFLGVGFHAFFPVHARQTTPAIERLLHERWRELNPSFARVTHKWDWDLEFASRQLAMMRESGTTAVYLTTFASPYLELTEAKARDEYAGRIGDLLNELVVRRKFDHVRWYCMANELSVPGKGKWAAMYKDLPRFEDYHRRIHRALRQRRVPVALLATDASPVSHWDSIRWAVEQMDDITGAYGGHHYFDRHSPGDKQCYDWFRQQVQTYAALAHAKGKPFIIGEFGPKQQGGPRYGYKLWNGCAYFDTPQEPMAALQTAEAILAAVNGGADAIAYWTFADFPDDCDRTDPDRSPSKWGTFRWDGQGFAKRPVYYAMGLMTRFGRGPATVLEAKAPADVRALAMREQASKRHTVAVLNRRNEAVTVRIAVAGLAKAARWEARLFDPAAAADYVAAGPLLNDRNLLPVDQGRAVVPPQSLAVFVER